MNKFPEYQELIDSADVYDLVERTPLTFCRALSDRHQQKIYLKREDMQPVFSFKLRGAFNKISKLSEEQRQAGLLAVSAGNHAQGVAMSGQYFKCPTIILMPETTPAIKIDSVKSYGAEIILHGETVFEAFEYGQKLVEEKGYTFIHPFDDPEVIAGQATIAKEILDEIPSPDYVFLPIGGGGIAAGMALLIKERSPETKLIGVEPVEAASMKASIEAGKVVTLDWVGQFADGVAVRQVGEETFRICRELLDEIVLVSTDEICAGIKDSFEATRVVMEPAGALTVAAINKYFVKKEVKDQIVIGVSCGANMNFDRLGYVTERVALGAGKEVLLAVSLPEKPGALKNFCAAIGERSISEFNYRLADPQEANVFLGIQVKDSDDKENLLAELTTKGYEFTDLSFDTTAKLHLRHMIGGKPKESLNEHIYRFEFPEKAGALSFFLNQLPASTSITLFHYRSHGSDRARVLIGFNDQLTSEFLNVITKNHSFHYFDESDNHNLSIFL